MAIIDMPVTTQETNDHPIDVPDESALVSTRKSTPSDFEDQSSSQEDGLAYNDHDSSEDTTRDSGHQNLDETSPKWTWGFKKLRSLLSEGRGAVTDPVVRFVGRHLLGTKLIFVVGKAGTGKTSILSELTDHGDLQPCTTLQAGTKNYRMIPGIIDDEQYLFVDTAGFGDPNRDDMETFKDSVSCLIALGSFVEVVGVLFVIGNPGTRLDQQDAKTLRWLQCFCGPDFFRNITIVTSFWDSYNAGSFKQAFNRMQSLYADKIFEKILSPSTSEKRYHGVHIYHHGVTGGNLTLDSFPGLDYTENRHERREELRNLIRRRYAERRYKPTKLQFMRQAEERVPFMETEAAKTLRAPAVGVTVNIVKGRCVIEAVPTAQETPPLEYGEVPHVKEASWRETVLQWWNTAVQVGEFFRDARQRQARARASTAGTAGFLQGVRQWWNGWSTAQTSPGDADQ
ncbi:uncharacterized protein BKA55DRAFT_579253 [Fusarium redolens]|uniref:G domain-containing protein n=1 Tax=Fusarium redolens TaxID=48865 RepID=A0A9P9JZK7_FUSRE|nr:uncharacterized protein BKA55DRAFT_579253 [Fusarium redolens]KAH7234659.1 hypothetical protein BKA55DRAFT_579253 [Fusarium redolens]